VLNQLTRGFLGFKVDIHNLHFHSGTLIGSNICLRTSIIDGSQFFFDFFIIDKFFENNGNLKENIDMLDTHVYLS
jgi:hypothetical protein